MIENSCTHKSRSLSVFLVTIFGIAVTYFALARISLLLAIPPGYASAIWPPAGIALAAALIYGYRTSFGVFLGSFAANLCTGLIAGNPILSIPTMLAVIMGTGAALQALLGAYLISHFLGYPFTLDRGRDVARFLLLGGPLSCLMNVTISVTSLWLAGSISVQDFWFSWFTWWIGDAIGVMIITPVVLSFLIKNSEIWKARRITVAMPLCLLLSLIISLYVFVSHRQQQRIEDQFKLKAELVASQIKSEWEDHLDAINSEVAFFEASTQVNREMFKVFSRYWLTRHHSIQALEWIPRVRLSERSDYEKAAQGDGYTSFRITERAQQGSMVDRSTQPEYFPVYYVEPYDGNEQALGFDLSSNVDRKEAIDRAIITGKPVATSRITLVQEHADQYGILVFMPIYDRTKISHSEVQYSREALKGFALGVFRIGDAMQALLDQAKKQDIHVKLIDLTAQQGEQLLYDSAAHKIGGNYDGTTSQNAPPITSWLITNWEIAGRNWQFSFSPTADYLAKNRSLQAWSILVGGLVFTTIAVAFLLIITGRTARVEILVRERTNALEMEIAERRQTVNALRESEDRYRSILNASPDDITIADMEGRILMVSQAGLVMFGYDRDESEIGRLVTEFIAPEDRDRALTNLTLKIQGSRTGPDDYLGLRKDGSTFDIEVNSDFIRGADGRATKIVFVVRDITERKLLDVYREMGREVLQILNEPGEVLDSVQRIINVLRIRTGFDAVGLRLQDGEDYPYFAQSGFLQTFLQMENSLINRTPDGNVCRDKDGKIMLAGLCGLVISGERDIDDPLFTPGGSFWVNDSAQLLDNPPISDHQLCLRYQCIHHTYISFALIPIRNKEKNVGLIHFGDHRKGCFTLHSIEILEGIASHIGATLMRLKTEEENKNLQSQLIQAQKMEAIGTLAGGIAHDFNNILGAIFGYTEMAIDASPSGSSAAKDMVKVLEAGHRAANLVKQILAFSRQVNTERVVLAPSTIAKEVIKLLRPSLPSTITISQQIDTATRSIYADPTQVHQIMMNLCTNAFHAMEQTGGTLEIILNDCELSQSDLQQYPEVRHGSFVMLSVSDTGTGIAPDIWERIYDPYFTTKEVGRGTGMGLSIVHGIVTNYGGFITGENNLGNGTIFRVYFPAVDQGIVVDVKPVQTALLPGNERLLLVDDEEMLAELGKTMLERLGYEVTIRTSSSEALAVFQNQPDRFDAVITDQTMPGMTGMDLSRRILQIRPDIPIILCTGYSSLIDKKQAEAEGIRGFIMKPLSNKTIAALLRDVLEQSKTSVRI